MKRTLCLLIMATWLIYNTEALECNPYTGPSGARHCIKLSQFYGYQWATCRTDSYLKAKSNGKHYCESDFKTIYCYYQCMLDVYGVNSGNVYGSCRCSPVSPGNNCETELKDNGNKNFYCLIFLKECL